MHGLLVHCVCMIDKTAGPLRGPIGLLATWQESESYYHNDHNNRQCGHSTVLKIKRILPKPKGDGYSSSFKFESSLVRVRVDLRVSACAFYIFHSIAKRTHSTNSLKLCRYKKTGCVLVAANTAAQIITFR